MIEKQTLLSSLTVDPLGNIFIQSATFYAEDGVPGSPPAYHRCVLEPGDDPAGARALVNSHMRATNAPDMPDAEWERLLALVPVVHTAEAIAARVARMEAQAAADKA